MTTLIKNCGLNSAQAIEAAITQGADFLGFIHYPPSPRHISPSHVSRFLSPHSATPSKVAVTVNASNQELQDIIAAYKPDYLQLHGDESPERTQEIRTLFGLPLIKAIAVMTSDDVTQAHSYETLVDYLLFDTKTPNASVHGGSGVSFDWSLLADNTLNCPYFLSGGLHADNVTEALRITDAPAVDVSSGIELHRGVKDATKIAQFNQAVRQHDAERS